MGEMVEKKSIIVLEKVKLIAEILFGFICIVTLCSATIGTLFVFFDIKWGWIAIAITMIVASFLTFILVKNEIFKFNSFIELIVFCVLELVIISIYSNYAPSLEIRQDPALYIFKALNLVNYGYVYKPMPLLDQLISDGVLEGRMGYAGYQNGTQLIDGAMYTDFFPGGTYVYALVGKINKDYIFYGQTIIMMVAAGLFFFALRNLINKEKHSLISALYVFGFFVAPINVFFGRGSFSENISLAMFLFLIIIMSKETPNKLLLAVSFVVLYSARMDFMIIAIIGIFFLMYYDRNLGFVYSAILLAVNYIFNHSYPIYSSRIMAADMKILKYTPFLIVGICVISYVICKYFDKLIDILYNSKIVKLIYCLFCLVVLMCMFRDNIGHEIGYEYATIHGKELMTYSEFILDLLFKVFPGFIVVGGLLALHQFLGNKNGNKMLCIFLILVSMVYMVFFISASNSPQLYWMLRRYMYVVLPLFMISFAYLISQYDTKLNYIVAIMTMIMSVNICLNCYVIADFDGLDKCVKDVTLRWENEDVEIILYESDLKYATSSLLAYSEAQFIPVAVEDVSEVCEYLNEKGIDSSRYRILSAREDESVQKVEMTFKRQGETYGEPPKEGHTTGYLLYEYKAEEYLNYNN